MNRWFVCLFILLTACSTTTPPPEKSEQSNPLGADVEILANLPPVDCTSGSTPAGSQGDDYLPNSPETTNLYPQGSSARKLILAGTVVNMDCFPIPHAHLDFWQANEAGNSFRGQQYTDNKGRYYLETVYPGISSKEGIQIIHVKVDYPGGETLTTQLRFPESPGDGLTIQISESDGDYHGIFNFILK